MTADVFALAADFNSRIIGIAPPRKPIMLPPERVKAFLDHLNEEGGELLEAANIADQIDALEDIIFIAAGRLYEMGVDGNAHFLEVAKANGSRVRGNNTKRPLAIGFDAVKPDGWVGPDHDAVLRLTRPFKPKILLLGHARHGKDTVAELLRDEYGLSFQSSSMFCAEQIMVPLFKTMGVHYKTVEDCFNDRGNNRPIWFNAISEYNTPDKARLARELMAVNDVYCGMRAVDEFDACERANIFDYVIWVDACERMDLEPESSFTIPRNRSDFTIDNNESLEDLKAGVRSLMDAILQVEAEV